MISLLDTALALQKFIQSQSWKFCFIGGLALQRWGEPRVTQDVDLTLLTGFGNEEVFIKSLLDQFEARNANAATFALENRVLLLKSSSGVGIDISLGGLPFEEDCIERGSYFEFSRGYKLFTASAEDIVIMKAFASRPRDWEDIKGIIIRQKKLDIDYINSHLIPLTELKEEPEILTKLENLIKTLNK